MTIDRTADGAGEPPRLNIKGARLFAWTAFVLLDALYLVSCIQRTTVPGAVFNNLQGDFLMTASQITWASSLYTLIYGTAQILTGGAVDRFGGKKMGILGGLFIAAGLLLLAFAKTPGQLYFSRALAAFGSSFIYVSIVKITHLLFPPKEYGAMIGLTSAVGFLGAVLGTLPARLWISWATGSAWLGWRLPFFVLGGLCLAVCAASLYLLRILRERPRDASLVTWRTFVHLFDRPGKFCFLTYNFWGYPVFFIMQAVLGQKFMQDQLGLTPDQGSLFTLVLSLASIGFCLAGLPAMRLLGGRRKAVLLLCAYSQIASVLLMGAGVLLHLPYPVFLLAFALLAMSQISNTARSYLSVELLDTRTIAFNEAVRNCFPFLGVTLAGALSGRVLDRFVASTAVDEAGRATVTYLGEGYLWVLAIALAFSLVHLAVILGVPETNGKRHYERTAA